jgi:hypothetical protein
MSTKNRYFVTAIQRCFSFGYIESITSSPILQISSNGNKKARRNAGAIVDHYLPIDEQ